MEEVGLQGIDKFEMHGIPMKITREEEGCGVVVFADLGAFEDASSHEREMLEANHAYHETAGAALCVDASSGHVFLRRHIWVDETMLEQFMLELTVFTDKAKEWRDRLREKNLQNPSNLFFNIV